MPTQLSIADLPGSETASRFEGADHGSTVSFFITRHPPGAGAPLHRHPYEETFIVEEGTAEFTIDGQTTEARAGQIVIVPAGAAHGFRNAGDGVLRQVSIHPAPRMEQEWLTTEEEK
ncbi:MAG TPA: cupin domain-containing protein [Thermoleophilaceae bacterium]|jgi:quercetin dioxygenase-like cupin family protein